MKRKTRKTTKISRTLSPTKKQKFSVNEEEMQTESQTDGVIKQTRGDRTENEKKTKTHAVSVKTENHFNHIPSF
jgi:hypothetical protein